MSAPRYDRSVFDLVRRLDDVDQPMAETCRKVGAAVELLGLTRPSYVHLRRIIKADRERRRELEQLRRDVMRDLAAGSVPRLEEVCERTREASQRAELRRSTS